MNNNIRDGIIKILCNHFVCSDIQDNQYPDCDLWKSCKCEAGFIMKRIDQLLESIEENQNSAAIDKILIWLEESEMNLEDAKVELKKLKSPCPDGENNTGSPKSLCVSCNNEWCPMNNDINSNVNIYNCSGHVETPGIS